MKKFLIMLLAGITLCMSACQQTPENPVVISKNDGTLESVIYGDAAPLGKYEAPETWQEEFENGLLKIRINANISVPDVDAYPVYRVTPGDITDEDALAFVKACVGDEPMYKYGNLRTKQVVMDEILEFQRYLEDAEIRFKKYIENGELTQEAYDVSKKDNELRLLQLQEDYKNAPDEPELELIENLQFEIKESGDAVSGNDKWYEIDSISKDLKKLFYITKDMPNARNEYGAALHQRKYYKSNLSEDGGEFDIRSQDIEKNYNNDDIEEMNTTYEQARKISDDFVKNNLKYENYNCFISAYQRYIPSQYSDDEWYLTLEKKNDDKPRRYVFVYTPTIDNIPVQFYTYSNINAVNVQPFWDQNVVAIIVDDAGILSATEISSLAIHEKLTSNASLISFDKVQDICRKHILMNLNYNDEHENKAMNDHPYEVEVAINDIRLGYVKMREKDNVSGTEGILVPVWMFYGMQTNKYKSQSSTENWALDENNNKVFKDDFMCPCFCINAIDGSIIDLSKGY